MKADLLHPGKPLAPATACGLLLGMAFYATGCVSTANRTAANLSLPCPDGHALAQPSSAEGSGWPWPWGAGRGSAVAPVGDAPGERDLDALRDWRWERQPPCLSCGLGRPATAAIQGAAPRVSPESPR